MRSLSFQQPLFARNRERYVNSEEELTSALLDIAGNPSTTVGSKTIVVCDMLAISTPLVLTAAHTGVLIRGVGTGCGLQPAVGSTLTHLIQISGIADIVIEGLTLTGSVTNGITIDSGVVATVRIRYCSITVTTNPLNWLAGTQCYVTDCLLTGTAMVFAASLSVMRGCQINGSCAMAVSGTNSVFSGNQRLGTVTSTGTRMSFTGNILGGNMNTSGGTFSVIVGNNQNGNSLTVDGTDATAGNLA